MDTQTTTTEEAPVAVTEKPGAKLCRVREELGLSQEEISIQLHLPLNYLCALEKDEIDKLPGLTFVRGYLRLYAKLLNLSQDEIINSFNILYPDMRERAPAPDRNYQRINVQNKRRSDSSVKWIGYSIVVIMVILVLTWWQSRNNSTNILNQHSITASGFQPGAEGSEAQVTLPADGSSAPLSGAASATPAVGPGVSSQMQMTTTNPVATQVANTVSNVPGLQADSTDSSAMTAQAEQKNVDVNQTTANVAAVPGLSSTSPGMTVVNNSSSVIPSTKAVSQQPSGISVWHDPDNN
ncbi:MAG: helix-turn-helix domain-containing protein [Legionellales bacterium]|nr:helix-turn-helix domain-containing protein [Legionellales bacterium]